MVTDVAIDSWKSDFAVPLALVSLINSRPSIRLDCTPIDRRNDGLDSLLLADTGLHVLELPGRKFRDESEMSTAKKHLLRICDLQRPFSSKHDTSHAVNAQQLGPQCPDSPSAILEELHINEGPFIYDLRAEHCHIWAHHMDLGHLHTLDLDKRSPTHLLTALTGRVPQLKDLTFGFWYHDEAFNWPMWDSQFDNVTVIRFLKSIDGLESVRMYSVSDKRMRKVRHVVLARHGATLRHLNHHIEFPNTWNKAELLRVYRSAPALESFTATLGMERRKGAGSVWPIRSQRIVTSFRSLRHLTLRIQLEEDSHELIDRRTVTPVPGQSILRPFLKPDAAKDIVGRLWRHFSAIERMDVAFKSPLEDTKVWTIHARKERDVFGDEGVVMEVEEEGDHFDNTYDTFDPFG